MNSFQSEKTSIQVSVVPQLTCLPVIEMCYLAREKKAITVRTEPWNFLTIFSIKNSLVIDWGNFGYAMLSFSWKCLISGLVQPAVTSSQ